MSDPTYACPRCGAPLATSISRCPICLSYVGFRVPTPFTVGWWLTYVGVLVALLTLVAVVGAVSS